MRESVNLYASISQEPNFTKFSMHVPIVVAQSCSDGVVICCVLSVLWMMPCLLIL